MDILIELLKKLKNLTQTMKFRLTYASRKQVREIRNYQRWISKTH